MREIGLSLPWPPTVNHYWGRNRNQAKDFIKAEGKQYQERAHSAVLAAKAFGTFPKPRRVRLSINAHPPDKRTRDLDNILKALLDALGKAGLYEDDAQVDHISISRGSIERPNGCVFVHASEIMADDDSTQDRGV